MTPPSNPSIMSTMEDPSDGFKGEEIFDLPILPNPLPITRQILEEEAPFSADPTSLVRNYMQQKLLTQALDVYEEMLMDDDILTRKKAADKVLDIVLEKGQQAPKGLNVTFNLNPSEVPKPEILIGEAIEIDEKHRYHG